MAALVELEALVARELRRAIAVDGRSIEAVGRQVGFSSGYLAQILRGRQHLKIRHIAKVLSTLDLAPEEFFRRVVEAAGASSNREERDPRSQRSSAKDPGRRLKVESRPGGEVGADRQAGMLEDWVRTIVRDELGRRVEAETHEEVVEPRGSPGPFPRPARDAPEGGRSEARGLLEPYSERSGIDSDQLQATIEQARSWARDIVESEPHEREAKIRKDSSGFRGRLFGALLLEAAREALPADPAESLSLAEMALLSCHRTCPEQPDPNVEAPALAVAGNAKRALGRYLEAEEDLGKARSLLDAPGLADPAVPAEVFSYLGSLSKDQGQLAEAAGHLRFAGTLYGALGEVEKAARVLLKLAGVHYRAHDFDTAVAATEEALALLPEECPAWLRASAHFNRAWYLHGRGDLRRAEEELAAHAEQLAAEGDWGALHLAWLRARIAWSREELGRAERLFGEARRRALARGIAWDVGLVSLELALVHLARGRTARVKTLATEALRTFREQKVEREVGAALELLGTALRREELTRQVLERVIATLDRARLARPVRRPEPS